MVARSTTLDEAGSGRGILQATPRSIGAVSKVHGVPIVIVDTIYKVGATSMEGKDKRWSHRIRNTGFTVEEPC